MKKKGMQGAMETPGTEGRRTSGSKVGMEGMKQHGLAQAERKAPKVKLDKQGGAKSSGPKGY